VVGPPLAGCILNDVAIFMGVPGQYTWFPVAVSTGAWFCAEQLKKTIPKNSWINKYGWPKFFIL
jgi:hypothetical protein